MRISNVDAARRALSVRRSTRANPGDGRFAAHLRPSGADAGGGIERPRVVDVGSILPVQELASASEREHRTRVRRYGEDILERLDELHLAILSGAVPADRIVRLARMLRESPARTDDLRLRTIIEEIELRAEVEIAKLTRDT